MTGPAQTLWEIYVTPGCAGLPISTQSPRKTASPEMPLFLFGIYSQALHGSTPLPRPAPLPPPNSVFKPLSTSMNLFLQLLFIKCYFSRQVRIRWCFFPSVATICSNCRSLRAPGNHTAPKERECALPRLIWPGFVCSPVGGSLEIKPR